MRKKGKPGVYIIQNIINHKSYIGASNDTYKRICDHKMWLRKNNHDNIHLQAAYNKYGEENFTFEILEDWDIEYIYSMENYWCNLLNTHDRRFGYNILPTGPNKNSTHSKETRERMSIKAEKRPVYVYTIYGEYFTKFTDLYKCGQYFNTAAANIHRKMNIVSNKKNLIDSELTKYIVGDITIDVSSIREYCNYVFTKIRESSGKYKVYDCFGNFIGNVDSRKLCNLLGVTISSITSSIGRGSYTRSLKITK